MCGIVGIYHLDGRPVNIGDLKKGTDLLAHRGPDDFGYLLVDTSRNQIQPFRERIPTFGNAECYDLGFGHRRLSIIDLSSHGHQPMPNEDGTVWIIYNGEIYNYLELRQELLTRIHRFHSNTDTETIIHAYEEWGMDCLSRFNGMWAFALWDVYNKRLFLARDRFGIKPLYYCFDGKTFAFSSEIKALVGMFPALRRPDYAQLHRFLKYNLIDDNGLTCFKDIKEIRPAHYVLLEEKKLKQVQYWEICRDETYSTPVGSSNEERFREILSDAVRLRLRSDVDLGVCLSGGIDSSTIFSLIKQFDPLKIKIFSVVYSDPEFDESRYINLLIRSYPTEANFVGPTPQEFLDNFETFSYIMDQPTRGPGAFSQWFVMKLAQGKVKVLLDGQGGDEILGGYLYFLPFYLRERLFKRSNLEMDGLSWWSSFNYIRRITGMSFFELFFRSLDPNAALNFGRKVRTRSGIIKSIYTPEFDAMEKFYEPGVSGFNKRFDSPLKDSQFEALTSTILPCLLRYEDRTSMAFSLETRLPFLDHRLVEFCFSLPYWYIIKGGITKQILRVAMKSIVPDEILSRSDKKGFPTPIREWLRGSLKNPFLDLIRSSKLTRRNLFNQSAIDIMIRRHESGSVDLSWELWRLLSVELWFQKFID